MPRAEFHFSQRTGWLRAAVLGANDGIVSTASLVLGVAAAAATRETIFVAGIAALVAGALSMAAGEYVSVSSQADMERADLQREQQGLLDNNEDEHRELAAIYVRRGLDTTLANKVAQQLMAKDALAAHAQDELGLTSTHQARPVQAALASALTFAIGAALPLLIAAVATPANFALLVSAGSLLTLASLGALAAKAGGAALLPGVLRVTLLGGAAMLVTMLVGKAFDGVA